MTLKAFAKLCGVKIVRCSVEWGGTYGYAMADHPNCLMLGHKTELAALKAWLADTFGAITGKAVLKLLKP